MTARLLHWLWELLSRPPKNFENAAPMIGLSGVETHDSYQLPWWLAVNASLSPAWVLYLVGVHIMDLFPIKFGHSRCYVMQVWL